MKHHYYPKTTQTVTVGAASAATTNAVGSNIHAVRLISTTACHIKIEQAPTATTSDFLMAANREEYFTIHPGEKVAVIQNAAGGTLYVTELTQ